MKTKFFMMGILSFTLVFGFIGCEDSGDDKPSTPGGITPPPIGSLPDLPEGENVTAVADETAAGNLLDAVKNSGISSTIEQAIYTVIGQPPDDDYDKWTYDFKDKESSDKSLKVSAKRARTQSSNVPDSEGDEEPVYQNGQYMRFSYENSTKAVISAEDGITNSSITALKGSSFQSIDTSSGDATITDANKKPIQAGLKGTQSSLEQYVIAFTVKTSDGKAGKIILDAKQSYSITYPSAITGNLPFTYSGSLKVYGADNNTPVKTIAIINLESANNALDYFGMAFYEYGNEESD